MTAKPRDSAAGRAPTDLDLMLYADGELEGDRIAAVEACLERDAVARSKLLALDRVSGLVRERATPGARAADGVAAAVMARIAAEASAPRGAPGTHTPGLVPVGPAGGNRPRPPSNDNARGLYLVAAFVVAAAAVVLLWRAPIRGGAGRMARGVVEDEMAAGRSTEADAQKPEADVEHGVEVSAIDFGGRTARCSTCRTGDRARPRWCGSPTTKTTLLETNHDACAHRPRRRRRDSRHRSPPVALRRVGLDGGDPKPPAQPAREAPRRRPCSPPRPSPPR